MNPLSFVTDPVHSLWDAVAKPFTAVFVVGVCYFINLVTSPGNPWWHWVAFGMSIAVLVAWARAFRTIVLLAVIFYVGRWIYRNYGDAARTRFEEWAHASDPGRSAGETRQSRDTKEVLRLIDNDAAVREAGIVQ